MGKNFESSLFKELCELVGVQKSHTMSFNPKCNGQTERTNRSLLQMSRATAQENHESWLQRLPTLMAAYRMTAHKVAGMTPNFAMFSHEVMLPASLTAKPPEEPMETKVPFVKNFQETLRDAHLRVREATQKSAKTKKSYYDRRSKCTNFKEGQLVCSSLGTASVMDRSMAYRIFQSPVVVQIRLATGKKTCQTVNIDRLVPCKLNTPFFT